MKFKKFVLLTLVFCISTAAFSLYRTQTRAAGSDSFYLGDLEPEKEPEFYYVDTTWQSTDIQVAGIPYGRGICMHPDEGGPAELVYDIEGLGYVLFYAIGGKDASAGAQVGGDHAIKGTNVQMQVYVDDVLKADSGDLPYPAYYEFKVDITGAKKLKLVVADGGDGRACDVTSWAEAQLLKNAADLPAVEMPEPSPEPTAVPPQNPELKNETTVYVSDMVLQNKTAYCDFVMQDVNISEEDLYVNGTYFPKGLCLHAMQLEQEAYVDIDLTDLGFTTFASYIGIAESMTNDVTMGSVIFRVYCDGVLKYESELISYPAETDVSSPELIKVDIAGVKMLRLAVGNGGDGISGDWGTYAGACVSKLTETEDIFATPVPTATPIPTATPDPTEKGTRIPVKVTETPKQEAPESQSGGWVLPVCIGAGAVIAAAVLLAVRMRKKEK